MSKFPKITLKYAQSLDGKIATFTGDSKWISSKESRIYVHKLRAKHDAILVGINTVIKDNPLLNVRLTKGKNPIRIILDSTQRIPLNSKIAKNKNNIETIMVTTVTKKNKEEYLKKHNIQILKIKKTKEKKVDLKLLLTNLYNQGIKSILVEGGSLVLTQFLKQKLVDKIIICIAPIIIGKEGIDSIGNLGIKEIEGSIKFSNIKKTIIEKDVILEIKI